MAKKTPESLLKPGTAESGEGHSGTTLLTRRGYKRLLETERQIAKAAALDAKALLTCAQQERAMAKSARVLAPYWRAGP
jgi:hypothetical protein